MVVNIKSFSKNRKRKNGKSNAKSNSKQKFRHNRKKYKKLNKADADNDQKIMKSTYESDVKSSASSDSEEDYEKKPRFQKAVKVRNLLPIKSKQGLMFRSEIVQENDEENSDTPSNLPVNKKLSLVEQYAVQRNILENLKRKVAILCTSIVEDPESNIVALKELVIMFQDTTTQMILREKKVLALSLLHVFSDIIPGYRIRVQEEKNPKVKLKKETKKLLGFEQALLRSYKKYLDILYERIREMKSIQKKSNISVSKGKVIREIGLISVRCMCELLSTKFHFNYFKNIANKLVPLVADCDEKVTNICCQSFERLFRADKLGEASFELVKQIVNVIKQRKFCVPVILLRTFLSLNLKEAKVEIDKIDMNKGRKEWRMMSRTERQNKKKIKELEAELKEAQAYECEENVKKFHTATLNKIFWVYFHILKDGDKPELVAPALEGLSKFAFLINLEFFDDLNSVLCGMMESGKLSDVEKLHGVYTLFTILAGQAESLHIDPHRIYCHMYDGLLKLNHSTNVEHFDLTVKCLEYNILRKKKKISFNRILAFVKRACIVSLQTPIHGTLGLLSSVRNIIQSVKGSDILLDPESTCGSGIYFPEMQDPEHCNAQSSALWELHILKKHYNPVIQLFAQHILHACPNQGRHCLPDKLSQSPEEILKLFAEVGVQNKMDFLEDNEEPPKKKFRFDPDINKISYEDNIDLHISCDKLKDMNFF
ncbi:nucleolar complex protein 3 homolog isoform X1 [Stegodyphus dumicola]|uniref:nucleolar complex protein 3 homolog isoform X1 n=1 Tax=Stegodyphus dumicola TaxID=202533 RepID=UPI0015B18BAD|nr:nucleolar complex protein 3 homolog isoform X1 [Stegodyphus dumicola]